MGVTLNPTTILFLTVLYLRKLLSLFSLVYTIIRNVTSSAQGQCILHWSSFHLPWEHVTLHLYSTMSVTSFVTPPRGLLISVLMVYEVVKKKTHIRVFLPFVPEFVYMRVGTIIIVINVVGFPFSLLHRRLPTYLFGLY